MTPNMMGETISQQFVLLLLFLLSGGDLAAFDRKASAPPYPALALSTTPCSPETKSI